MVSVTSGNGAALGAGLADGWAGAPGLALGATDSNAGDGVGSGLAAATERADVVTGRGWICLKE